jgi:ribosomal protein S26
MTWVFAENGIVREFRRITVDDDFRFWNRTDCARHQSIVEVRARERRKVPVPSSGPRRSHAENLLGT